LSHLRFTLRKLAEFDGAALFYRAISRFDDGHRLEVCAPGDCWFRSVGYGRHEFGHRAGECLGKPTLLPAWPVPFSREVAKDYIERAGTSGRVFRPPDSSLGDAVDSLDPPLDGAVRPAEAIIDRDSSKAIIILEN